MRSNRSALAALAASGILWGFAVPLSKLALGWLAPAWLTIARFAVAAPVLALLGRRGLRDALRGEVVLSGAIGFGAVIVLQNVGLERTSVSHAAVVVGAAPVIVALLALRGGATPRPAGWAGYALALGGVALVAGGGGAGSSRGGDLLVLASATLSACFVVAQPRLLAGRDAAAVTAVQFAGAGLAVPPVAILGEPLPHAAAARPGLALLLLAAVGTVLPYWLFAVGQARVPAEIAGVWLNLEPVVGAVVGWIAFGNSAATAQLLGAATVVAGIVLGTLPSDVASGVAAARHRLLRRRQATAAGEMPFAV